MALCAARTICIFRHLVSLAGAASLWSPRRSLRPFAALGTPWAIFARFVLCIWRLLVALDDVTQSPQLVFRHRAKLPDRQAAEPNRAEGDAFEFHHLVTDFFKEPADFAILSFTQHHFENRAAALALQHFRVLHFELALGEPQSLLDGHQRIASGDAGHMNVIGAIDAVLRMRQLLGEIAVVGDNKQPGAAFVQTADREQARPAGGEEINDAGAALGILHRAQDARRLIEDESLLGLHLEPFAVEANVLLLRFDLGAEFIDRLPIDGDSPARHQGFAFPACPDAALGEEPLQTDGLRRRRGGALLGSRLRLGILLGVGFV